jgi:aminoglycoside phosphotransferase (APT) family kinase protein
LNSFVEVLPAHRFDIDRLQSFLAERLPGVGAVSARQFKGGQSNPTFYLQTARGPLVLRKKPPGVILPSAHRVEREFRIISALYPTAIPVPQPVLLCEDDTIIGTAFYVMQYVEGEVFIRPDLPGLTVEERRSIYDTMNASIAALHQVDSTAVGLQRMARKQMYLARQIDRWSQQYQASIVGQSDPRIVQVIAWLRDHTPDDSGTSIVHGDFRLGNLLFLRNPVRLSSILDWELSTLGDPISDLAYCCMPYHLPAGMGGIGGLSDLNLPALGIPTESEFVAAYCHRTGRRSIAHWDFYLAFSLFRLTAIVQGVYARSLQGNASNANAAQAGERATVLAGAAHAIVYRKA